MIRCPKCGDKFDYREAVIEEDWIAIIKLLPSFGTHGRLVWEYVERFSVKPLQANTAKLCRLFGELSVLFITGKFAFEKKTYTISQAGIAEAMRATCNAAKGVLKNHNYLKQIMIGIAEQEGKERSREEERQMRQREEKLRQGERPNPNRDFDGNAQRVRDLVESL